MVKPLQAIAKRRRNGNRHPVIIPVVSTRCCLQRKELLAFLPVLSIYTIGRWVGGRSTVSATLITRCSNKEPKDQGRHTDGIVHNFLVGKETKIPEAYLTLSE